MPLDREQLASVILEQASSPEQYALPLAGGVGGGRADLALCHELTLAYGISHLHQDSIASEQATVLDPS